MAFFSRVTNVSSLIIQTVYIITLTQMHPRLSRENDFPPDENVWSGKTQEKKFKRDKVCYYN